MRRGARLASDAGAAAAIEAAFALPILILIMIGSLQLGMILHASAGMRHAVGEGIRFARVYPNATEAEILQRVRQSFSGIAPANVTALSATRGEMANKARFARITMRYRADTVVPFIPLPPILLEEEKTTWLPQ